MILAFCLFLLIYSPRIGTLGDINTGVSLLLISGAIITGTTEPSQARRIRLLFSAIIIGLIGYWFAIKTINQSRDLYFLYRFLRVFVQFWGTDALIRLYFRTYRSAIADRFLLHLYFVIGAHAIIMLIMYIAPPVRDFVYTVTQVDVDALQGNWAKTGARTGGLLTALDTLSAVQAFGIVIYPLVMPLLRGTKLLISNILFLIICFSILVSGRTGFIILLLFAPLVLLHVRRQAIKILSRALLCAVICLVLLAVISPGEALQKRIDWQVQRLQKLLPPEDERMEKASAKGKLSADWLHDWPDDLDVLLFGNSRSARQPGYLVSADPGYILDTHGLGLVGMLIFMSFYIFCLFFAIKCFRFHKRIALASLLYTVMVLIVNAKVRFAMAREGFSISVALLVITIYMQNMVIKPTNLMAHTMERIRGNQRSINS